MKNCIIFLSIASACSMLSAQTVYKNYSPAGFLDMGQSASTELLATGTPYWLSQTELWKLDADGNALWSAPLPNSGSRFIRSVTPTASGNYLLCGDHAAAAGTDLVFAKVNAQGQIEWQKEHNVPQQVILHRVFQLPDQTLTAIGASGANGTFNIATIRLDKDANAIFSFQEDPIEYDTLKQNLQYLGDAYLNADNLSIISASNDQSSGQGINANAYLLKTTIFGQLMWKRLIDRGPLDVISAVSPLADGGIAVAGYTNPDPGNDPGKLLLMKYAADGQLIWEKTFLHDTPATPLFGADVLETNTGNLIVTARAVGAQNYSVEVIVADPTGAEINRVSLTRNGTNDMPDAARIMNNMLAVAGSEDQQGESQNLLILLPLNLLVHVEEIAVDDPAFVVYPNPTADVLNMSYVLPEDGLRMEIHNSQGQIIYEGQALRQFQFNNQAPGVYVVVLRDGKSGKAYVRRLVRQ